MLAKNSRLSRELFLATFKKARRAHGLGFQLLFTPSPTFGASVVVAKKILTHAVDRNYLRRRTYAVLRECLQNTPAGSITGRYIVIYSTDSKKYPLAAILQSLCEVMNARIMTTLPYTRNPR